MPDPPASDSVSSAIRVIGVSKQYGHAAAEVTAVHEVSFEIARGEKVALLGKSGSGKSTLLNLIGGLDRPTSGRIEVHGRDLGQLSRTELADYRRDDIGFVFQSYNLISTRTALQNAELPLILRGESPRVRRERAATALQQVGLGERADHRPSQLSGGEQQRVAIARALINSPGLLLADEPTGNLDTETAARILELLADNAAQHAMTMLLVTHDEELAVSFADRTLRMQDGALIP
jgi:ABC-type lipoprotein export system ATPase subunit